MTIPVTRRRENTRARLLEAAAQVFAEVGLEGASVEAICERAGFTRGAFYSNFESKDQLFLALASSVAEQRLASVRGRIDEFVASGVLAGDADPTALVQRIMDSGLDDRLGVLMMSEIRIRALRDEAFGRAYLEQDRAMVASIESIIQGLIDTGLFALRIDVPAAARMLMIQWEGCMARAALDGLDGERLHRVGAEALGQLVDLIIAPAQ
ncbi:TetR/AcrR family transcriptional regulator [Microbacterium sp. M28]|uniref:TetR/AcrR family transcriptional regulator n=1 Tax=Microbacterium sp. M28 TaxID=2962064 RepID=UPI0021F3E929|nr:TetR/AcrR family transcriptional regulator [Microbacterium sp. M28]UYO96424.1 TetR/AcrR family transcriptional regulator [Microbacterium sp. M28]